MFNADSVVVKVWFSAVMAGTYKFSDVPNLSNLRDEVEKKLVSMGYDTGKEV